MSFVALASASDSIAKVHSDPSGQENVSRTDFPSGVMWPCVSLSTRVALSVKGRLPFQAIAGVAHYHNVYGMLNI